MHLLPLIPVTAPAVADAAAADGGPLAPGVRDCPAFDGIILGPFILSFLVAIVHEEGEEMRSTRSDATMFGDAA